MVNFPMPMGPGTTERQWPLLLLSWLISLISSLGALYFSEVADLEPCVLCWFQRIAMFPLVLILGIGAYTQDASSVKYALPLSAIGWLLAAYHCLLYGGLIPKGIQPCGKGISCSEQKLELIGFITIPLLSLAAFSFILLLLLAAIKDIKK
ncbi:disulfide bond formation protein B [Paracidovorax konjaci]|uniref:Disulfide bond formation protein DsbB n=1 Tax=Paracidovorax konjaci TaxID=32040 RepID=A0A1I1TVU5_9BURK|nr:disulfide bond formation protein B [Paracidovorax konjaci]SFD62796.1 disulfide bond formation protein DsbB [Paracidovorax konjaci]